MTLGGLMCTFIPTMVLVYYCPDLESTAPTWVYVLNAAGIFIYQVLLCARVWVALIAS